MCRLRSAYILNAIGRLHRSTACAYTHIDISVKNSGVLPSSGGVRLNGSVHCHHYQLLDACSVEFMFAL